MSKNLILIFVVILLCVGGAWWYLGDRENDESPSDVAQDISQSGEPLGEKENNFVAPQNNTEDENRVIATDDFSVRYPEGWKSAPAPMGVSAIIVNQNETISDPQAKKANFHSYFSVSYDSYNGKTQEQYIDTLKQQLFAALFEPEFLNENTVSVNGQTARAFEIKGTQSGFDFHVLMVVVEGVDEDVWVLSFNTLESLWDGYTQTFADITNSFVVKK